MQVTGQMKRDLAEDGAIRVRGLFTPEQLARVRECYDHGKNHPTPNASKVYEGTDLEHFDDYANEDAWGLYCQVIKELGISDLVADLWGDSEHVWFFGEELFHKYGGRGARTPWHQDTAFFAANGSHMMNIWISFEHVPKKNGLKIVRGSHLGTQYDGPSYADADDLSQPLWGDGTWPLLPDIDADLAKDPASWDIMSWDVEPGDVLALHSGTLHGGAEVDPDFPERNTIVLRFFGDQFLYRPLPTPVTPLIYDASQYDAESLTPGEPYRDPKFVQLR